MDPFKIRFTISYKKKPGMHSIFAKRIAWKSINVRWKYMSSSEVRHSFVKYFENHEHTHIPSSSVVPDDESLLFTTAGMNQFKPMFIADPSSKWKGLQRAVAYQKCIRAGGKHNDLEDVGHDLHHQTFFEMLGNWSFNGTYSKECACRLAWQFLVDVMKIDPDRLYVTYFGGNTVLNNDKECKEIWKKIGIPADKIIPFDEENFWEMGFSGPAGMCTEIHYDRIAGRKDSAHLVNKDNSVVELWNIVFMDKKRNLNGVIEDLPSSHIDTGMGLERLVSVVQNVDSNYDTDLFIPLIERLTKICSLKYKGSLSSSDSAIRLIVDHIRACTIAIKDGALPAGDGAGFVVRKMLRRAFLQSSNVLNIDRGCLAELVPVVVDTLNSGYPELTSSTEEIRKIIEQEEWNFWRRVDKGRTLFDKMSAKLDPQTKLFPGSFAWDLLNSHGVPIDVTIELAQANGREIDLKEFKDMQQNARNLSQKTSSFVGSRNVSLKKSK